MRIARHCAPVLVAALLVASTAQAATDPICGRWLTEDKEGIVHVYLEADRRLAGRLVGGASQNDKDVNYPNPALRGRPLIELKLMQGFVRDGDRTWKGGEIYDPDDGKTYKATARLSDNDDNQLLLRGYVGVPVFGRTEEWTRAAAPDADACRDPGPK